MSYVYNRDFDQEIEREQREAERLTRAFFTEEDLAAAIEKGRAEGIAQGRAEGRAEAEAEAMASDRRRWVELLGVLSGRVEAVIAAADDHVDTLEQQVVAFELAVFEKIAPELLKGQAAQRSESEVRAAIGLALGSAQLRIFLPPDACAAMATSLEEAARDIGHDGRIEVLPDPELAPGDARVEWDNGFMEYSFSVICTRILTALRAASLLPEAPEDTPDEE